MIRTKLTALVYCALCFFSTTADAAAPQITAKTAAGRTVTVTALTDNILKVTNAAPGETLRPSGASVLDETTSTATVTLTPSTLTTATGLTATLADDGTLTIDGGAPQRHLTDKGVRTHNDSLRRLELSVAGNGSFYGAGERGHHMNLRGDTLVMYNRANYGYTGDDPRTAQTSVCMPLFLSSDGYAVVFDDHAAAKMALGNTVVYLSESDAPVSYYYVNSTGSLADLTTEVTTLTGRQDLPPLWALGYITSKYGYHNETEALDAVDSLKALGYPLDGLVLDLYWYGKEQDMGRLEWDSKLWPDPKWFADYLNVKGAKLVAISQPFVLKNGRAIKNYDLLAPKGLFVKDANTGNPLNVEIWVGNGGLLDVSNPSTQQWLANRLDSLTALGITGWWGDLGEPEVHPAAGLHHNGLRARTYHNKYGNDWAKIIYDMYAAKYPDRRLMILMRAGTTGLQRYSVFPWSGDVSRSWGGLEPQIRIMLQSGLSGLGYMGHDVGGFAINPDSPMNPELYVRWLQLGLFSPMLRTHAQNFAEPYHYTAHQDIIKPLIKERYRWLPYIYTLAWENATKGWPLVRPLDFHSDNPTSDYDEVTDQFLWGRDIMVAPVLTEGATERSIVFPKGDNWVDISDPLKIYAGGTTVTYPAPLSVIPVFARQGSFIPRTMDIPASTKTYSTDKYYVDFYPAGDFSGEGHLFEDDLKTPTATSGNKGRVISFYSTAVENGKYIDVTLTADGTFAGAKPHKSIAFSFKGLDKEPAWIEVGGKNSRMTWDKATGTARVDFNWRMNAPIVVRLKR